MKKAFHFTLLLFFLIQVSACTVGPVEEPEDPAVPEGPGVLTGESGEWSLIEALSKRRNSSGTNPENKRTGVYPSTSSDINVPAIDAKNFEEFEAFKAWRRAQNPDSPDYQEYQDWRAYQQYLRFREQEAQKGQTPKPD